MSTIRRQHRFATVPEDLLFDSTISPGARCLYAILDRHADGEGRMWPGMKRIAWLLGVTEETARKFRGELEENGWLVNQGQANGSEGFGNNRYVLIQVRDTANLPAAKESRVENFRARSIYNESHSSNESQGNLLPPDGGKAAPKQTAHECPRTGDQAEPLPTTRPDPKSPPTGKGEGKAVKSARERNPAWDALAEIEGHGGNPSPLAAGGLGKALKAIRSMMPAETTPEAVAAEIRRRACNWPSHFDGATLSAMALAKWWGRMDAPKVAQPKPGGWAKHAANRDAGMQGDWQRQFADSVEEGKTV